eukprot:jgi/Tetstr1/460696/TSEL_000552.t1
MAYQWYARRPLVSGVTEAMYDRMNGHGHHMELPTGYSVGLCTMGWSMRVTVVRDQVPYCPACSYYGRAVEELRNGLLILERTEAADYNAVWRTVGRTLGGLRHVGADFHRDMGLLGLHIEAKEKQEHQRAAAATQHDGEA